MGEKEKMLSGQLYKTDKELKSEYNFARKLCFKYNRTCNSDKRRKILKKLLGKTGNKFSVEPNFWCDYGYNIFIGDNFYMNHNCVLLDCAKIEFGDNVFVGPNCGFYTVGHPLDFENRNKGLRSAKSIKVGNNVWIGGNVVLLPGVTIGDNSIIGAGSVVTKDIPENVIACGSPCKVIKDI